MALLQLLCSLVLLTISACSPKSLPVSKKSPQPEAAFDRPWLLVTPFTNFRDSVISAELAKGGVFLHKLKGASDRLPAQWLGQFKPFREVNLSQFLTASPQGYMLVPIDSLSRLLKTVVVDSVDFFQQPAQWPFYEKVK